MMLTNFHPYFFSPFFVITHYLVKIIPREKVSDIVFNLTFWIYEMFI